MFKKLFVLTVVVVLVLALGAVAVFAQVQDDAPPAFGPYGPGQGMMDGHGYGMMGRGYQGYGMMDDNTLLDVVAEETGLSVDEVIAELQTGLSIAQLAENHGVDVDALIATFVDAHDAALQEEVEAGTMSQEQAEWMQAHMLEMIQWRVQQPYQAGVGAGMPGGCHGYNNGSGSTFRSGGPRGMMGRGWQAAPTSGGAFNG